MGLYVGGLGHMFWPSLAFNLLFTKDFTNHLPLVLVCTGLAKTDLTCTKCGKVLATQKWLKFHTRKENEA